MKRTAAGKLNAVASIREGVKSLRSKVNDAGTYRRNMVSKRWKKKKKRSMAADTTKRPPPQARNIPAPG